jgi:hypothetical protein
MLDWQLAYLGRRTFPADITEFELQRRIARLVRDVTAGASDKIMRRWYRGSGPRHWRSACIDCSSGGQIPR